MNHSLNNWGTTKYQDACKLWPHPIPDDHDFDKLESTLSEDVFTEVTAFLGKCSLEKKL